MESSSESRKASASKAMNASLLKLEHNRLVVNLTGLIDALMPTENTPEADMKRKVGQQVRDKMIETCLV